MNMRTVKMSELKACPFCGGTDIKEKENGMGDHWMRCSCSAKGPRGFYPQGVWNTRTPDPLAEKVDADFHLLEENISLRYRLDSQQKVIDAAIALLPHEGYLATRGTKEKSDFFIAVKALQKANNNE